MAQLEIKIDTDKLAMRNSAINHALKIVQYDPTFLDLPDDIRGKFEKWLQILPDDVLKAMDLKVTLNLLNLFESKVITDNLFMELITQIDEARNEGVALTEKVSPKLLIRFEKMLEVNSNLIKNALGEGFKDMGDETAKSILTSIEKERKVKLTRETIEIEPEAIDVTPKGEKDAIDKE